MAFTKVSDRLLKSGVGSSGNSRLLKLNSSGKLAASLLTGALPAIDGSALTGISTTGVVPFAKADGTSDPINLTNDQEVPFIKTDGTVDNIALTI
jgi:hypothetical protein